MCAAFELIWGCVSRCPDQALAATGFFFSFETGYNKGNSVTYSMVGVINIA
jgi:hypothetical protein